MKSVIFYVNPAYRFCDQSNKNYEAFCKNDLKFSFMKF